MTLYSIQTLAPGDPGKPGAPAGPTGPCRQKNKSAGQGPCLIALLV